MASAPVIGVFFEGHVCARVTGVAKQCSLQAALLCTQRERCQRGQLRVFWTPPLLAEYGLRAMEQGLQRLYAALLAGAVDAAHPTFDTVVVVVPLCGYQPALEPDLTHILAHRGRLPSTVNNVRSDAGLGGLEPLWLEVSHRAVSTTRSTTSIRAREWTVSTETRLEPVVDGLATSLQPQPGTEWCFPETVEHVCYGGTFDHLHNGHRILLTIAAVLATKRTVCGLSDGPLLKNKRFAEALQPLKVRKAAAQRFLNLVRRGVHHEVDAIVEPCGPSIVDPGLQLIALSQETQSGGATINEKRRAKGMAPLSMFVIGHVAAPQDAAVGEPKAASPKLSSTQIRQWITQGTVQQW
eukprot:m.280945 g.280945  ORF g.280945 m.280945 type:complete len:353 (+) comp19401_c3_seq5:3576-4634(+)